MTARFGVGAQRLAGLAGRVLGWRPGEFWGATPAELATILMPLEPAALPPLGRTDLEMMMEREQWPRP